MTLKKGKILTTLWMITFIAAKSIDKSTHNASKLSFDGLIARLDLLGHQLKLISFLTTLVEVLAKYQQSFTLAVQLPLTGL